MINQLVGTALQLLLFTSIPFIVYFVQNRSVKGFFDYIGLKKSTRRANLLALLVVIIIIAPIAILVFTSPEFKDILLASQSVTGQLWRMGPNLQTVFAILLLAYIKTALTEEIFFRGFLAKRLIAATNFQTGNVLQALIFGILHSLLFLRITDNILFLLVIFLFPTIGAYLKTYLNEKMANGSIIPGWIAHGTGNFLAYSLVVFSF